MCGYPVNIIYNRRSTSSVCIEQSDFKSIEIRILHLVRRRISYRTLYDSVSRFFFSFTYLLTSHYCFAYPQMSIRHIFLLKTCTLCRRLYYYKIIIVVSYALIYYENRFLNRKLLNISETTNHFKYIKFHFFPPLFFFARTSG